MVVDQSKKNISWAATNSLTPSLIVPKTQIATNGPCFGSEKRAKASLVEISVVEPVMRRGSTPGRSSPIRLATYSALLRNLVKTTALSIPASISISVSTLLLGSAGVYSDLTLPASSSDVDQVPSPPANC